MAKVVHGGAAIRLESSDPGARRREWATWRSKGYRILDPDGVTVWEESEGIRRLVLRAFEGMDADVFLFGSRVTGGASEHSDWDVGYRCTHVVPKARLAELREDLERLPIPGEVELVDFADVPAAFQRLVLAKGVQVWKRASKNSLFTSESPNRR